jgi:glycosyltransferase involved in cell wall biosynthesis
MSAVIMQYIAMLDRREYQVALFTDEIAPQFLPQLQRYNVQVITSQNRKKNQIAYYKELVALLKKEKFDIIHAHGNSATLAVEMLAAKRCAVPVRIAHSHNTTCVHKFLDKLLRPLFYASYTHGVGCGVEAGKWLFGSRDHMILKNGVDLEHFAFEAEKRNEARRELGITDKFVVGHVGRFTEQKNHEFIIRVFQKYAEIDQDAVLLLVGDGPKENEIKQLVHTKHLDKKVLFAGTTPNTDRMYSAMDVFIFPSKFEGVPLTLIEAQANGLHCLISDKISSEVIQTKLVDVLSINTEEEWVDRIKTMRPERNAEDSTNAIRQLTEAGFSLKETAQKLNDFYKTALNEKQKSGTNVSGKM